MCFDLCVSLFFSLLVVTIHVTNGSFARSVVKIWFFGSHTHLLSFTHFSLLIQWTMSTITLITLFNKQSYRKKNSKKKDVLSLEKLKSHQIKNWLLSLYRFCIVCVRACEEWIVWWLILMHMSLLFVVLIRRLPFKLKFRKWFSDFVRSFCLQFCVGVCKRVPVISGRFSYFIFLFGAFFLLLFHSEHRRIVLIR